MNPSNPKSAREAAAPDGGPKSERRLPFEIFTQNELLIGPYRSLAKTLMHTHHNAEAFVQINRKLADELREIVRRQQDFVIGFSERVLHRLSNGDGAKGANALPVETIDEYFESAMTSVREFGKAFADAQVHSIEAFKERAHEAAKANGDSSGHAQAAE